MPVGPKLLARALRGTFGCVLLGALLGGCGDSVQIEEPPPATRGAEVGPQGPGRIASHGTMEAVGAPHPMRKPGEAIENPAEVLFEGSVELAAGFELPETYTLFVCAGDQASGRPLRASRRFQTPGFPLDFTLRRGDLAGSEMPSGQDLVLFLILSERGTIEAKDGLYLRGTPSAPVAVGTRGIVLTLAKPD